MCMVHGRNALFKRWWLMSRNPILLSACVGSSSKKEGSFTKSTKTA